MNPLCIILGASGFFFRWIADINDVQRDHMLGQRQDLGDAPDKVMNGVYPSQTVPKPNSTAASRMFCVAALQSCTQNFSAMGCLKKEVLPHTTIAAGASNLANINDERTSINRSG